MTQYMLLFSLGPVQSFIAQARKTRDLWLGSYLLSLLMEAGMEDIQGTLVFPADRIIKGTIPDLPNKYIAIFDDLGQATEAAEKSEQAIKNCWYKIRDDVWWKIIHRYTGANKHGDLWDMWERQTNAATFFEIFWAIAEGNDAEYSAWLSRTQEALAARKQSRHSATYSDKAISDHISEKTPFPLAEPGEKSTISGEREALHGNQLPREFWQQLAGELSKTRLTTEINIRGEERLDAIDTIKRFAYHTSILKSKLTQQSSTQENEEEVTERLSAIFPSTSSVATASFVERLLQHEQDINRVVLNNWFEATKGSLGKMSPEAIPYLKTKAEERHIKLELLRRDGDCYFPETFTRQRLEKDYAIAVQHSDDRARRGLAALKDLLRETARLPISHPTPYYAMIQMDGDKMGTLLGKVVGEDEHKKISGALSKFSCEHALRLVEEKYPGRLIYAGGDDVFALAPLARDFAGDGEALTVLNLVDQLQQQYHDEVIQAINPERRSEVTVTASVGIAIAHHYTSLSYVRRMSKEAEERAKKHYGRNALVVRILRRSGEQTQVGCKWHYDGLTADTQPTKLFSKFYDLFKNDLLSPKCVYTLLEEAATLTGFLTKEAQASEIKRVLIRQTNTNKQKPFSKEDAALQAHYIVELANAMDVTADKEYQKNHPDKEHKETKSAELHSTQRRYGLVEVLGWLLVMNFLTRKEQE